VEVHHPLETCYDSTMDELQLSYEGGSAPSIRKPVMSYDSTVDELQLSYQGSTSDLGNLSPKPLIL